MNQVDWTAYAREYDLMAQNNPAYQELVAHCIRSVSAWELSPGDTVADFGAGTGNFSVALARALPDIQVLHLDGDRQMIQIAKKKAAASGGKNWSSMTIDFNCEKWGLPEIAGVVSVHCIYALNNPRQFIRNLCGQLRPGAYVYACDFGRQMQVSEWARYMLVESLHAKGIWNTVRLFARSGQVRRQNRRVAACQRNGTYWTHELAEYEDCFKQQGMAILETSNKLYRSYDDLVIARKQRSV